MRPTIVWLFGALVVVGCDTERLSSPPTESPSHEVTSAADTGMGDSERLITVIDPRGDHTGAVDLVRMDMAFSAITGEYRIVLRADRQAPFAGDFRINLNFFNPDVGATAQDPSFFMDVVNDFSLPSPIRVLALGGTDPRLTQWDVGDRVFTNSLEGTGNPDGVSLFRSGVQGLPLGGFLEDEDFLAFAETAKPAVVRRAQATRPPPDDTLAMRGIASTSLSRR